MKKRIIFLVWILLTGITSCNNLELFPPTEIASGVFWQTEKDIQMGLAGVYSRLKDADPLDWRRYMLDNITDNGYNQYVWEAYSPIQNGNIEATSGFIISNLYVIGYRGVSACNIFLENFPTAAANAKLTEAQSAVYEAEVRFLRALYYFELVSRYGDLPLYKEVLNSVDEYMVKQSPASDIYAFIHEDLDFAIRNLPDTPYSTGHAVKGSAQALKVRAALFQGDWNMVETVAKDLISSGKYRLSDNYESLFIKREGQKNNPEILFTITYVYPQSWYGDGDNVFYYWQSCAPLNNLVQCYEPNDVRLKEWYQPMEMGSNSFINIFGDVAILGSTSVTGWLLMKHFDKNDPGHYNTAVFFPDDDIIVLRLADVYLMYIEAMVEKNGGNTTDALALQCMNEIRRRAEISEVTSISRDELRLERRRELAWEGLYHSDLIRWRTAKDVMNALVTPSGQCKFEDHFYYWPFPLNEMDINPNLDQKPGYK